MSKYTIHSTREDWQKLYDAVKPYGEHVVRKFKKMQSYDTAVTMYSILTKDYKLAGLGYPQKNANWCVCPESVHARGVEYCEDNTCECGVAKHHYHCMSCRSLLQIG